MHGLEQQEHMHILYGTLNTLQWVHSLMDIDSHSISQPNESLGE